MKEAEPNNKVLLGMSGGTDSSVAALLLQDAGYEVTGITFRFYEKGNDTEYLEDARALCERLGIPHLTYDVRGTFRKTIIDYFINEYMAGHTPVPCTLCNNYLKWPLLKRISDEMGIYHFATGHYVRRRLINGYYHITTGADPDKDQSFFLWGLPQEILQRMLLPMGNLTKARVREIAAERGFLKAAQRQGAGPDAGLQHRRFQHFGDRLLVQWRPRLFPLWHAPYQPCIRSADRLRFRSAGSELVYQLCRCRRGEQGRRPGLLLLHITRRPLQTGRPGLDGRNRSHAMGQ